MFDGQLIPHASYDLMAAVICCVGLGLTATVLLRVRFEREWSLTVWTAYKINRVWQRLADESARTGGTLTSHVLGLLAWCLLGSTWSLRNADASLEGLWTGMGYGALIGLGALLTRTLTAFFGGWITLVQDATKRGLEIDRHMRNWLLWILMLSSVVMLSQNVQFGDKGMLWNQAVWIWWAWLVLKWLRQIQSVVHSGLPFGWGIVYICTFEFGPTYLLFKQFEAN